MKIRERGILVAAIASLYYGLSPETMSAARKAALRSWAPDRQ